MSKVRNMKNEHNSPNYLDQMTPKKEACMAKLQDNGMNSTLPKSFPQSPVERHQFTRTHKANKKKHKKLWTKEQDQLLRRLVQNKGAKQWAFISTFFSQRCGKQCRERWHNHLRNGINKGEWTLQEEWILYLGVQTYEKKWSTISKLLQGRTQNTLKNHWNCKMKPKKQKFQKRLTRIMDRDSSQPFNLSAIEVNMVEQIKKKNYFNSQKYSQTRTEKILKLMKAGFEQYKKSKRRIWSQHLRQRKSRGSNLNFNDSSACVQPTFRHKDKQISEIRRTSRPSINANKTGTDDCEYQYIQFSSESEGIFINHYKTEDDNYSIRQSSNQQHSSRQQEIQSVQVQLQKGYVNQNQPEDQSPQYLLHHFQSPQRTDRFQKIFLGESNSRKRLSHK